MSNQARPIRVFLSYSHDSKAHVDQVRQLSDRLRTEGVDSIIDQYEMSPPQGWPRWMMEQIQQRADFVIVVCTEVYNRRVSDREEAKKGFGAKWEGAIITQELYDSEGLNTKFIPVVFSTFQLSEIPHFLRGATRYDLSDEEGYEGLYRQLTSQPRVLKLKLGPLRKLPLESPGATLPTDRSSGAAEWTEERLASLILLHSTKGGHQLLTSKRIQMNSLLEVQLIPTTPAETAFISDLRTIQEPVGIAFGTTALLTTVSEVSQGWEQGKEVWTLILRPFDTDYGAGFMEMSTTGYSADKLAEMRAERLLLGKHFPPDSSNVNDALLEILIRGQSTPIQVTGSPFPELYDRLKDNPPLFLTAARLFAVLLLRLAGIVEHILDIKLTLVSDLELEVDFKGRRAKKYSNVDPTVIEVRGRCSLTHGSAT